MKNVIIIMDDQHHAGAFGYQGHPVVKTPNFDSFAAANIIFDQAFTSCPLCQPARISMLTGMYCHATQIYDNIGGMNPSVKTTRPDLPSLARYLKAHGYYTGTTGKYHAAALANPGWDYQFDDDSGYDEFIASRGMPYAGCYNIPDLEKYPSPSISCSIVKLKEEETRTAYYADCALRFLDNRPQDKPFFLWMNFDSPHGPYTLIEKYACMYNPDSIPVAARGSEADFPPETQAWRRTRSYDNMSEDTLRKALAFYYGSITEVDQHFGRFINALMEKKLYDNTIIIFLADHGDHAGDFRMVNKAFAYDSTLKIPFLMHAPGSDAFGKINTMVQNVDIFPTVCDALGLPKPMELQGSSFYPFLNPAAGQCLPRKYILSEEKHYKTIRTQEFKLVYAPSYLSWQSGSCWTSQLYDLKKDPCERNNVFNDSAYSAVKNELIALLLEAVLDREFLPEPVETQAITNDDHTRRYAEGHRKKADWQAKYNKELKKYFNPQVYLPTSETSEGKKWAGGG